MSPLSMLRVLLWSIVMASMFATASAIEDAELEDLEIDPEVEYYIRLHTGDVYTGLLSTVAIDGRGAHVSITTSAATTKIYAGDIAWISTRDHAYRARNRGAVLPTAEAIGNDMYVGLTEVVLPTIGFGVFDVGSITLARTLIPGIGMENQLSLVNLKATVHEDVNGLVEGGRQIYAIGFNGTWLNDVNFLGQLYGVATFTGKRARVSTMIFGKVVGKDDYTINTGSLGSSFRFPYANGTMGIGLMIDVRFPEFHDLRVLAELWGANIQRPSQSVFFLGLRSASTAVTYDFGLGLFPGGNLVPVVNFAWNP